MYFVRRGGLKRGLAAFLCAALLLAACGPAEGASVESAAADGVTVESVTATTMYLAKSEGSIGLTDDGGRELEPMEQMGLYSGYQVATRTASYAWIDLDRVKLTKMDADSEVELSKKGKELELLLKTGRLFFNVTEPLADDETMDIRTSTMVVGIRGTCGWVEAAGSLTRVYILEGMVECCMADGGEGVSVSGGQMAEIIDGEIAVKQFWEPAAPEFVREELLPDEALCETIYAVSGLDFLGRGEAESSSRPAAYTEENRLSFYEGTSYTIPGIRYNTDDVTQYEEADVTAHISGVAVGEMDPQGCRTIQIEIVEEGDIWRDGEEKMLGIRFPAIVLCDIYSGRVVPNAPTRGDMQVEYVMELEWRGRSCPVTYGKTVSWEQGDWEDNLSRMTSFLTYRITIPDGYDGLALLTVPMTELSQREAGVFDEEESYIMDKWADGGYLIRVSDLIEAFRD